MRKLTFSLLIALFTLSVANAQINKGTSMVGGSIYYNQQKTEQNNNVVNQFTKRSELGIVPSYGFAVKDNLIVGADISYTNTTYENGTNNNSNKTKNNGFGIGVFARPYRNLGSSGFYLYAQGRLGAGFSKESSSDLKGFDIGLGINPGVAYAVTPKMHIETGLNNLFYAGYSSSKTTNGANTYKSSGFNANIGLGSSTQWTVGVKFLFGS